MATPIILILMVPLVVDMLTAVAFQDSHRGAAK